MSEIPYAAEASGHTPEAAQRFAPEVQGVDREQLGRGIIRHAVIGRDHA